MAQDVDTHIPGPTHRQRPSKRVTSVRIMHGGSSIILLESVVGGSNIFENLACHHWGNTQTHYRYPGAVGQSDYLQLESQRKTCVRGVQE